jgi:glycosyltransferase involved in cell wall biosynthesis
LEAEFKSIAPTFILKSAQYAKQKLFFLRVLNFFVYRMKIKRIFKAVQRSHLIVNNTIATGNLIKDLGQFGVPIITYVHEMQSVIEAFDRRGGSGLVIRHSDYFITPAQIVSDNLIERHGIKADRIFHLNSFIPLPSEIFPDRASFREIFFNKYKIPARKFYVVAMGTATHRKGIDIFIEACKEAVRADSGIYFTWIGDFEDNDMRAACLEKIKQYGIEDDLRITGRIPHSIFNLLPFDLFVLSSREDPYPLVVIEAAYMSVPAICFRSSGGAAEFLSPDCGWVIPEISAVTLAAKINELKEQPEQLEEKGKNAYKLAISRHSQGKEVATQFEKIVETVLL